MSVVHRIARALALATLGAAAAQAQGTGVVTLELEGPLSEVVLDAGRRPTRVRATLAQGERATVAAPLALPESARGRPDAALDRLAIRILPEGAGGQARAVALAPGTPDLFDAELSTLVTLRSRAPLGEPLARLDAPRALVALATVAAVLALARRRLVALLVGAAGAALALLWPAPERAELRVRVIEGDARLGEWVAVDGAVDRLEVPAGRPPFDDALRQDGAGAGAGAGAASIEWEVEAVPGAPARWWLAGPGHWLYSIEVLGPSPRLDGAENDAFALERTWVRAPGGEWSDHGAWELGAPLPAARASGGAPPGWLAAGLPQGVSVLIGRIASSAPSHGAAWLRLTGFERAGNGVDGAEGGR